MSRVGLVLMFLFAGCGGDSTSSDDESLHRLYKRCTSSSDCNNGQYCKQTSCGDWGTCAALPTIACPPGGNAVCGCDGSTYASSCFARQAGVTVASKGACRPPVQLCTTDSDCNAPGTVSFPGQCNYCNGGQCATSACRPPAQLCVNDSDCNPPGTVSFPGQCNYCNSGQCAVSDCRPPVEIPPGCATDADCAGNVIPAGWCQWCSASWSYDCGAWKCVSSSCQLVYCPAG